MLPYRSTILALAIASMAAGAARGQDGADATLVPKGLLRIEFAPHYTNYDRRFALGSPTIADGELELLGADFTADTAGVNLFPALGPSESALRQILADDTYRINVGNFNTIRDADIRRFPFSLSFGLTNRITLSATLPIVTHRMQVAFVFDSTDANVGWNQALAALGGDANANAAAMLVSQLSAAVANLSAAIAGGGFGCPSSAQCADANATLNRATILLDGLMVVTGADASGGSLASFAPLESSAAGQALLTEIATVAADLQALGTPAVTATLPLPVDPISGENVNELLTDPDLGYAGSPLSFIRGTSLGDAEVSLRFGLAQSSSFRAALTGMVRLPTGTMDLPDNFLDLGTGDAQMDLVGGLEIAWQPGAAGIALGARYTLQMTDNLVRRIGPPGSPILPLASETMVTRDLGDIIQVSAFPTLRLSDLFIVYASASYYKKQADTFSDAVDQTATELFPIAALATESEMEALSLGGGISYRTTSNYTPGGPMPIEASVSYRTAFNGKGGLTPKTSEVRMYLRLFMNVFGGGGAAAEPEAEVGR